MVSDITFLWFLWPVMFNDLGDQHAAGKGWKGSLYSDGSY